ncbi:MAG: cytochrome-c peroxidase [Myxococcota bacterium]
MTLILALIACSQEPAAPSAPPAAPPKPAGVTVDAAAKALFAPLPARMDGPEGAPSAEKIALGRMLYHEKRLSKGGQIACASCHQLDRFGVDGEPTSPGHEGQRGGRNSPTSLNAAGHVAQFWDGRAATIEDQAKGPVLNPIEMAMPDEKTVVAVLGGIPEYRDAFAKAFPGEPDPVTYDNMAKAIGAFERGLVTPSRWDKFLAGDDAALTDAEKTGFNTFVATGCASCHGGAYVGGASYQKLGMVNPWPDTTKDEGRFAVTKADADKMVFKVPSLRNVAKTGPWFHDGSVTTLEDAVKKMGHHQLGKDLSDADVASIVTWLGALTGELDPTYVAGPAQPAVATGG